MPFQNMTTKTDTPDGSEELIEKATAELANIESAKNLRFWSLVIGIIFFFGCHNYMQELIMSLPGFKVKHSQVTTTSACL